MASISRGDDPYGRGFCPSLDLSFMVTQGMTTIQGLQGRLQGVYLTIPPYTSSLRYY